MPVLPLPSTAVVLITLPHLFYAIKTEIIGDTLIFTACTEENEAPGPADWSPFSLIWSITSFKKRSTFVDITSIKV